MNKWGSYGLIVVLVMGMAGAGCVGPIDARAVREANRIDDLARARQVAPMPQETLDLDTAIDYALKHNLQLWMARQQKAIEMELQTGATLKMLPDLRLNIEDSRRNKFHASKSVNVFTGRESLTTSYSAEKSRNTVDLTMAWNLLDFGVTYLRVTQQAGRVVIAEQQRRRLQQRVVMEVTTAYWQAVAARQLAEEAERIRTRLNEQITGIRNQLKQNNLGESAALEAELPLLRQRHRMATYRRTYDVALQELGRLMGVPVGARFEPVRPESMELPADQLTGDMEKLEELATLNRPELYQDDMRSHIATQEARIALIEMFPAPSVFWRYSHDENTYLWAHDWQTVGITTAWDVLSLPQKIYGRQARLKEVDLARKRRVATTLAVLTQVHIAAIEYDMAVRQLKDVKQIESKSSRLLETGRKAAADGKSHGGRTLSLELQHLADLDVYLQSYVQTMGARARLINSVGVEPAAALSMTGSATDEEVSE